jgi:hypothetical protein
MSSVDLARAELVRHPFQACKRVGLHLSHNVPAMKLRLVIIEDCQKVWGVLDLHGAKGSAFHKGSAIRS